MPTSLLQELLQARHSDFTPAVLEVIDAAVSQGLMPSDTEVGRRVLTKIEELKQPIFRGSKPVTPLEMTRRIEAALAYETELLAMTDDELREVYRDNYKRRSELRHRKALHYDHVNFGQPKHEPDFEIWNRKIVWTVREALCLSLDKEPSTTDLEPSVLPGSILKDEYELRKNALISLEQVELDTNRHIEFFVDWFRKRNVSVPSNFGSVNFSCISDQEAELTKLRQQVECLEAVVEKSKPQVDRRASMHAMIYCMAVDFFKYDPNKTHNPAVKRIEDCMYRVALDKGNDRLKAGNNTVRNLLKEAAQFLAEFDDDLSAEPEAAPQ